MNSRATQSSDEFQWVGLKIGHQDCSIRCGHQGDKSRCVQTVFYLESYCCRWLVKIMSLPDSMLSCHQTDTDNSILGRFQLKVYIFIVIFLKSLLMANNASDMHTSNRFRTPTTRLQYRTRDCFVSQISSTLSISHGTQLVLFDG